MTDYAAAYDAVTNPVFPLLLAAAVGAPVVALAALHHRRAADSDEPLAPEPPRESTSSVVFTCGLCGRPARVPVWAFSHRWLCPACEDIATELEQTADELGLPA